MSGSCGQERLSKLATVALPTNNGSKQCKIPGQYVVFDIINTININILLNIHQYNNRMTGILQF